MNGYGDIRSALSKVNIVLVAEFDELIEVTVIMLPFLFPCRPAPASDTWRDVDIVRIILE